MVTASAMRGWERG